MTALIKQEALTAIYVDFESLGNKIDRPAILGVLDAADGDDRFRQFVLDGALTRGAVARKGVCVNATPEEAVTAVVEEAEQHHLPVVSWSTHECEVVRATCSVRLADRFCAVYRNALETAKPLKRHLYPNFKFVLTPFGGKHPLKEYFRMTGYDLPATLRPTTPAKWLKHTLQQMEANGGRYPAITQEAKRDWHKLLHYNEHDCRGMRAVTLQAAHELALWAAYQQTRFVVFENGREITIHAGGRNPKLDRTLIRFGVKRWAFLTAYNPESVRLDLAESERRHRKMLEQLRTARYSPLLQGEGRDPEARWVPEPSVLVPRISGREARKIARDYGQLAILVGQTGFQARLVASGLAADRHRIDAGAR